VLVREADLIVEFIQTAALLSSLTLQYAGPSPTKWAEQVPKARSSFARAILARTFTWSGRAK
jgi:hypothetical protein